MAKLILLLDQVVVEEYLLDKASITLGRRPSNDIQIDNLAVSGEHALIEQIGQDFFIEDLDSTNGTKVNDKAVKKHLLQHEDIISLGKFELKYINDQKHDTSVNHSFEKTIIYRPPAKKSENAVPHMPAFQDANATPPPANHAIPSLEKVGEQALASPASLRPGFMKQPNDGLNENAYRFVGKIQVLNGSSSGRELVLSKALTTLGKPGVQVAVITKRHNGYYITHVEGRAHPLVNGNSTGVQAHLLADHDVIELAGVKMEFYLESV